MSQSEVPWCLPDMQHSCIMLAACKRTRMLVGAQTARRRRLSQSLSLNLQKKKEQKSADWTLASSLIFHLGFEGADC